MCLRQIVIELHPEVHLGQMFVKVEGFAKGGKLFAEPTFRERGIRRPDAGRSRGRDGHRLRLAAMTLQPVLGGNKNNKDSIFQFNL
jgi:hypothetical protein